METTEREQELKVIVFQLKDEEYGVDIQQIRSVEQVPSITRVPRTPVFVKGVINLRGVVTPIVDLRERFKMEHRIYDENTRIIIVNAAGMEVGLVVDSANDVMDVPLSVIAPAPEIVGGINAAYLQGVAKLEDRLLILLDLERVLNNEELRELHSIGDSSH